MSVDDSDTPSVTTATVLRELPSEAVEHGPTPSGTLDMRPGPPEGFGVGVNEYFNHYIAVADAKAAGFMAAALTVAAAVLGLDVPSGIAALPMWAAVGLLAASVLAGAVAIFPRLPKSRHQGLIFWEDVRLWPTVADYQKALSRTSTQDVEFEYAAQNHTVSGVLHDKHVYVRWTIGLFLAGALMALVAYGGAYA